MSAWIRFGGMCILRGWDYNCMNLNMLALKHRTCQSSEQQWEYNHWAGGSINEMDAFHGFFGQFQRNYGSWPSRNRGGHANGLWERDSGMLSSMVSPILTTLHICMCVYIYMYKYIYMYIYICVCIYIYVCVCVYRYIYIYIAFTNIDSNRRHMRHAI